jgi:hypothetical protein
MASHDMIAMYNMNKFHDLQGHLLRSLLDIAIYGKNLFLAVAVSLFKIIALKLNFE